MSSSPWIATVVFAMLALAPPAGARGGEAPAITPDGPARRVQARIETYAIRPGDALPDLIPRPMGRLFSFMDEPFPFPMLRYEAPKAANILAGILGEGRIRAASEASVTTLDNSPASVAFTQSNWGARERFELRLTPRIVRDDDIAALFTTSVWPDVAEPGAAPTELALPLWRARGTPYQDRLIWVARAATPERGGVLVVVAFAALP